MRSDFIINSSEWANPRGLNALIGVNSKDKVCLNNLPFQSPKEFFLKNLTDVLGKLKFTSDLLGEYKTGNLTYWGAFMFLNLMGEKSISDFGIIYEFKQSESSNPNMLFMGKHKVTFFEYITPRNRPLGRKDIEYVRSDIEYFVYFSIDNSIMIKRIYDLCYYHKVSELISKQIDGHWSLVRTPIYLDDIDISRFDVMSNLNDSLNYITLGEFNKRCDDFKAYLHNNQHLFCWKYKFTTYPNLYEYSSHPDVYIQSGIMVGTYEFSYTLSWDKETEKYVFVDKDNYSAQLNEKYILESGQTKEGLDNLLRETELYHLLIAMK